MATAVKDSMWHVEHLPAHLELDTGNRNNLVRVPLVVETLVTFPIGHRQFNLMPINSVYLGEFLRKVTVVVTELTLLVGRIIAEDDLSTLTLLHSTTTTFKFANGDDLLDVGVETTNKQLCKFLFADEQLLNRVCYITAHNTCQLNSNMQ